MTDIRDNTSASRFEMQTEWGLAILDYHDTLDAISLDHTEVPEGAAGKGVGARFVLGVLDNIRARGRKIIPRCPFVQRMLKQHPQYADLILS
ncbi:GNAT family N-acetyltransferase [Camelimonas sp. ID_303_24]